MELFILKRGGPMLRGIWLPSWELQGTETMAWGLWSYDGSLLQGSRKDAAP